MTQHWTTGDVAVHRHVGHGDGIVWSRPHIVVSDSNQFVVLYQPEGTVVERFDIETGQPIESQTVRMNILRLMFPGQAHAVLLFFDAGSGVPPWYEKHFSKVEGAFKGWKIDLESPFKRTPIGFDTTDNTLDVMVRPNLSWYWKDEEGLALRVSQGVFTPEESDSFYEEGRRVIAAVENRLPPFSEPWPQWEPDASWPVPGTFDGWQELAGRDIDLNRNEPYRSIRLGAGRSGRS